MVIIAAPIISNNPPMKTKDAISLEKSFVKLTTSGKKKVAKEKKNNCLTDIGGCGCKNF